MGSGLEPVSCISPKDIGQFGGGKHKPNGNLDVAMIQSLIQKGVVSDIVGNYGYMIVDECHHISAASFEQVVRQSKAKYLTVIGDRDTQGWAPADYFHAVRSSALQDE